jgi:membrane protease YdiL (CAAX protease family)
VAYVALSTIAGLFYGFAYWKTKRIEASMLVHFGTNAIHFFAFSYPALVPY